MTKNRKGHRRLSPDDVTGMFERADAAGRPTAEPFNGAGHYVTPGFAHLIPAALIPTKRYDSTRFLAPLQSYLLKGTVDNQHVIVEMSGRMTEGSDPKAHTRYTIHGAYTAAEIETNVHGNMPLLGRPRIIHDTPPCNEYVLRDRLGALGALMFRASQPMTLSEGAPALTDRLSPGVEQHSTYTTQTPDDSLVFRGIGNGPFVVVKSVIGYANDETVSFGAWLGHDAGNLESLEDRQIWQIHTTGQDARPDLPSFTTILMEPDETRQRDVSHILAASTLLRFYEHAR